MVQLDLAKPMLTAEATTKGVSASGKKLRLCCWIKVACRTLVVGRHPKERTVGGGGSDGLQLWMKERKHPWMSLNPIDLRG